MKKPLFTAVPNDLIDVHMRDLTESQLKCLLAILRKTYGWHREVSAISLAELASITGMSRSTCSDAVNTLADMQLISKTDSVSDSGAYSAATYEPVFDDENTGGVFGQPNRGVRPAEQGCSASRTGGVRPAEQGCSASRTGGVRPAEQHKEERKKEREEKEIETPPTPSFDFAELRRDLETVLRRKMKPSERRALLACETGPEDHEGLMEWAKRSGIVQPSAPRRDFRAAGAFDDGGGRARYHRTATDAPSAAVARSCATIPEFLTQCGSREFSELFACYAAAGMGPKITLSVLEEFWPTFAAAPEEQQRAAVQNAKLTFPQSREFTRMPLRWWQTKPWTATTVVPEPPRKMSMGERHQRDLEIMLGLEPGSTLGAAW